MEKRHQLLVEDFEQFLKSNQDLFKTKNTFAD